MRSIVWCAVLVLAVGVLPGTAAASVREKLRVELAPLVKHIVQVAQDEKQATLAIGAFVKPPQTTASVGPGIEQILIEELELTKPGIVNRHSVLSVTGQVKLIQEGSTFVRLTVNLELTTGKELGAKKHEVKDSELVAFLLGLTLPLPAGEGREELQKRIGASLEGQKPGAKQLPFAIRNKTQLATQEDSPFAVELLVTKVAQTPKNTAGWRKITARELTVKDGYPVLPVDRGEVYALRVINTGDREAAVAVAIDGVDIFQLAERATGTRPPFTHYIVPPQGDVLVTGWFLNSTTVSSFLVAGAGEGVVTKLGQPRGKVGTISVTFALAWEGDNVPPDEKGKRAGGKETGEGPRRPIDTRPVKRSIGVIRDVITLLYDR